MSLVCGVKIRRSKGLPRCSPGLPVEGFDTPLFACRAHRTARLIAGQVVRFSVRILPQSLNFRGFACRYQLHHRETENVPVFFVSGAFQTMASWRKFARHFAERTSVLLADLPGCGQADLLPRELGLDFLAEAARSVMDAAGLDRAYIVSASYGSPIAYRFSQLHPERVDRLVLAGVMREIPREMRARTERTLISAAEGRMQAFAKEVVDGLLCQEPGKPIQKRGLAARLLSSQLEKMSLSDRQRYVENTARLLNHAPLDLSNPPIAPTLVFTGEYDIYTRPAHCREIAAALPNALFTVIEQADHLFHLERFDTTLALLDRFYEDLSVDGVPGCGRVERVSEGRTVKAQ